MRRIWDWIGHTFRNLPCSIMEQIPTGNTRENRKRDKPQNDWKRHIDRAPESRDDMERVRKACHEPKMEEYHRWPILNQGQNPNISKIPTVHPPPSVDISQNTSRGFPFGLMVYTPLSCPPFSFAFLQLVICSPEMYSKSYKVSRYAPIALDQWFYLYGLSLAVRSMRKMREAKRVVSKILTTVWLELTTFQFKVRCLTDCASQALMKDYFSKCFLDNIPAFSEINPGWKSVFGPFLKKWP